jgi:DNA-binding XRE family transcriptional regulator
MAQFQGVCLHQIDRVALPFCNLSLAAPRPPALPRGYPTCLRTLGDHIRRKRLGLGQGQRILARQLGVREETVHLWETGCARPLPRHYGRIVRFLGYDPEPGGANLGERIRATRRRRGLTQADLAAALGADEGTVADLEADRRRPSRKIAAEAEAFIALSDGDRCPEPK